MPKNTKIWHGKFFDRDREKHIMDKTFSHLEAFITDLVNGAVKSALELQNEKRSHEQIQIDHREEFLNSDQAASYLHIAKQTLYTLTSKRKISFYKNGKKILFRQSDLDDWLNRGKKHEVRNDNSNEEMRKSQ